MQHATCNMQHATRNMQRTCNMQHMQPTCSMHVCMSHGHIQVVCRMLSCCMAIQQHATCNMQHATCNMQHAMCNMQHATCNMQHAMCRQSPWPIMHVACCIHAQH